MERWNEHNGNKIIIEILTEWIGIKRKIAWMEWKLGKEKVMVLFSWKPKNNWYKYLVWKDK